VPVKQSPAEWPLLLLTLLLAVAVVILITGYDSALWFGGVVR
jgi:hypothetical protein